VRFLLLFTLGWAQVNFTIEPIRYYTPEGQPYLELFIAIEGSSVTPSRRSDSLFAGEVLCQVLIKNLAEEPIYADKFVLTLGPWSDTLKETRSILYTDVRRLRLPTGLYTLEVTAQDKYQQPRPQSVQAITQFEIPSPLRGFGYSDLLIARRINLADSGPYRRHGLAIDPLLTGGVVVDPDTLALFGEVYHVDSLTQSPYFLRLRILDAQRATPIESLTVTRRPKKPTAFEAFVFTFPAHRLESGIYLLQVELCNNDGEILAAWYRRLTLLSTREPLVEASEAEYDTQYGLPEKKLNDLLDAMMYLATPSEKSFLKTLSTPSEKKRFFVAFWKKRENKPGTPPSRNSSTASNTPSSTSSPTSAPAIRQTAVASSSNTAPQTTCSSGSTSPINTPTSSGRTTRSAPRITSSSSSTTQTSSRMNSPSSTPIRSANSKTATGELFSCALAPPPPAKPKNTSASAAAVPSSSGTTRL
jgi:hypothetical protein